MIDIQEKLLSNNHNKLQENVHDIKVIYTDIDGTLVGKGGCLFQDYSGHYTLKVAEAIVKALDQGTDIVPVSGRNRLQMRDDARLLGIKNYICELGCQLVYNLGEKIILNLGEFKITATNTFKTIAESGAVARLFEAYSQKLEYHLPWAEGRECTHLLRGNVNLIEANSILKQSGYPNLKLVDNGVIQRKSKNLEVDEIHAYHLLPKAAGKGAGVEKDMFLRKHKRSETIGIGDSLSDLAIATWVGTYILVAEHSALNQDIINQIKINQNIFLTSQPGNLGWAEAFNILSGLGLFLNQAD